MGAAAGVLLDIIKKLKGELKFVFKSVLPEIFVPFLVSEPIVKSSAHSFNLY